MIGSFIPEMSKGYKHTCRHSTALNRIEWCSYGIIIRDLSYLPNLSSEELLMDEGWISKGVLGGNLHAMIEPCSHHQDIWTLEEHSLASINRTWQRQTPMATTSFKSAAGEHALACTTPTRWSAYSMWKDGLCASICKYVIRLVVQSASQKMQRCGWVSEVQ